MKRALKQPQSIKFCNISSLFPLQPINLVDKCPDCRIHFSQGILTDIPLVNKQTPHQQGKKCYLKVLNILLYS